MTANGSSHLNRSQAEQLAHEIADALQSREFEKHPHIGLIGPGTRRSDSDPLDLMTEIVEEQTEQWLSPYVHGYRVSLKKEDQNGAKTIKACFSFLVRVSAPTSNNGAVALRDQLRAIDLCFIVKNEATADVSFIIYDEDRSPTPLYSSATTLNLENGSFRVEVPEGPFRDSRGLLTTTMELGYGSQACRGLRFTYGFGLAVSLDRLSDDAVELAVRLIDGDGYYTDANGQLTEIDADNSLCRNQGLVGLDRKPWSVAQLLEVQSTLSISGYSFMVRSSPHGIAGLRPINCAYDLEMLNHGELRFQDYAIVPERARALRPSDKTITEFMQLVGSRYSTKLGLSESEFSILANAIAESLQSLMGGDRLYVHQQNCCMEVLDCIAENLAPASAVPMGVQTAGGKTLGFLTPICIYNFAENNKPEALSGVKSVIFYPTKALINDQSDTIIELLWGINTALRRQGKGEKILSFGLLHGDTPNKGSIAYRLKRTNQQEETNPIRLKCPLCGSQLQIHLTRIGDAGALENVSCTGARNKSCSLCTDQNEISFLNKMLRATREAVYSNPPDILVCTPDMINYRLFFSPSEQSIFGRKIKRCNRCNYTTANIRERAACPDCGEALEGPYQFTYPKILVFDEAHQLRGSFGSQVSHVMTRFEQAVRTLTGNSDYRPVYVFSSATLPNPEQFVKDFLSESAHTKSLVQAQYLPDADIVNRIHLFMVPKGYSPEATLRQTVEAGFHNFPFKERHPNVLIFVNSLAEANELINLLRHYASDFSEGTGLPVPIIDGHSTDYGNKQREEVEDRFTRGEINILVATTTLAVGLDFDKIDMLIIYGAPYFLSDYVQRMGRAGRKHAAVIASILPSKPIDFFFFGNYPLITDLHLRDAALKAEAVRISRENEVIRGRTAVRAFLDYLCTRLDAPKYFNERNRAPATDALLEAIFRQEIAARGQSALESVASESDINPEIFDYVRNALQSEDLTDNERSKIRGTIDKLTQVMVSKGITGLRSLYTNKQIDFLRNRYATDLRMSDYIVTIEHPDLLQVTRARQSDDNIAHRERTLAIAIGDYCPGQVTSYRSAYFVVNNIETDHAMSARIRDAVYGQQRSGRRDDDL